MSSTSSETNLKHNNALLATEESSHLLEKAVNSTEKYGSQQAVIYSSFFQLICTFFFNLFCFHTISTIFILYSFWFCHWFPSICLQFIAENKKQFHRVLTKTIYVNCLVEKYQFKKILRLSVREFQIEFEISNNGYRNCIIRCILLNHYGTIKVNILVLISIYAIIKCVLEKNQKKMSKIPKDVCHYYISISICVIQINVCVLNISNTNR